MPGSVRIAAGFEQEPRAPLGCVQEIFEQAGRCGIPVFVGQVVCLAHGVRYGLVVCHQLTQHVVGSDERRIIVLDRLMLGDIADGTQCGASNLAHTLGYFIGGGKICSACSSSRR